MASFTTTHEQGKEERQYAMQIASALVLPMALMAAIELGVLEVLEKAGPGYFIKNQDGGWLTPLLAMIQDKVMMETCFEGGIPFYKAHKMNSIEYMGRDARFYEIPFKRWFWILHMWDVQDFVKLLKDCCEALLSNGEVIAVDMVVPKTTGTNTAARSLLQTCLLQTKREFQTLAREAGFSRVRVASCAYNFSVLEFLKLEFILFLSLS
ncbi:hypothetical protein P3X46_030253 [Hevea brasiliensis]|uniref:O-methyltransferase C-terminal domain-containing protein n=1 Tax=Hevea brasiliensis TaxID=3981 RepID=A0ABQ9KXZ3_HEVBR|nr:hypothetical protein P3X46_030253 [Hevea brasiliensis]